MDNIDVSTYIFNKQGNCIFSSRQNEDDEKHKLIYGFLHTLKCFIVQISDKFKDSTEFIAYSTDTYSFFVLELPTGYKFTLITHFEAKKDKEYYKNILQRFYRDVYVELVVKNPALKPGQPINSELFREKVIEYYKRTHE